MIRGQPLRRFWQKVEFSDNGCWNWKGAGNGNYGMFWCGRQTSAHRFSYEVFNNCKLPPSNAIRVIDHLCRNKSCVNPAHLELVTNGENIRRGNPTGRVRVVCPKGHPYDAANTYVSPDNRRNCRECHREANRRYGHPERIRIKEGGKEK